MAHKAVLAGISLNFGSYLVSVVIFIHSPEHSVRSYMFKLNMMETEMFSVNITDFEDEIIKAMLEYIYTGETDLLTDRAPDLHQIAGFKENSENMLAENLSEENAANMFVIAQTFNANLLKPRVIEYINW